MAESTRGLAQGPWPVIVNSKLKKTELCQILKTHHKVKVSDSTIEGSCIFPVSSVAFLVLYMSDIMEQTETQTGTETGEDCGVLEAVTNRLEKCLGVHRCPYVVCIAPMFGDREMRTFCALQRKYMETSLQFLAAHNEQECEQVMNTIAKTRCKPASEVLKTRLKSIQLGFKSDLTRDTIFAQLPISHHDRQILQDTLHSIENVSMATEQDFLDYTSLDRESIKSVMDFFRT